MNKSQTIPVSMVDKVEYIIVRSDPAHPEDIICLYTKGQKSHESLDDAFDEPPCAYVWGAYQDKDPQIKMVCTKNMQDAELLISALAEKERKLSPKDRTISPLHVRIMIKETHTHLYAGKSADEIFTEAAREEYRDGIRHEIEKLLTPEEAAVVDIVIKT